MKPMTILVAAVVTAALFVTGAVAQHEEHHQDQPATPADKTDTGKPGGSMPGGMMPQMMMGQNETAKLVDQLVKSFPAIETEKDPAALKAKLAEHEALLKELQAKIQAQSHMMDMMQHMMQNMMGGSMMGGSAASGQPKN